MNVNDAAPGLTDRSGLHDGLLPLATTSERQLDVCCGEGRGRRSQRRIQRKVLVDWLVADAAQATNALYRARAGRPLEAKRWPDRVPSDAGGGAQRSVLGRFRRHIDEIGMPPPEVRQEEALSALLRSDDTYTLERGSPVEPFDLSRIRVCKGDLAPKNLADVLDPGLRQYVTDADRWIVRPDSELADPIATSSIP